MGYEADWKADGKEAHPGKPEQPPCGGEPKQQPPVQPVVQPVVPPVADIVLAQDLSGSFANDLPNLQAPFLSNLNTNLTALGATDVAYGVTSFIDYPFPPFGTAGMDFIYNTNQPVTTNVATAQASLGTLAVGSGNDGPEAQLVALQQAALRGTTGEIGLRPGSDHFVVLATDAPYHVAGDFPAGGPNNNNTNLADGTGPGGVEDYPSIAQVADDLSVAGLHPIFAVTADQIPTYQALLNQMDALHPNIGGSVVMLSPDSSNLASAIVAGLMQTPAPMV